MMWFGSFGDVDLDLSVEKIDIESSIDGDAVGVREEDVADDLSVGEGMVGDELLDTARHLVGDRHQQFTP